MRPLIAGIMLLTSATFAVAQERPPGRYQTIIMTQGPHTGYPDVIILDTMDGHVWRYWLQAGRPNFPGSEGVKYITTLRPGSKPGEIIHSETFR